jgi:hypothetical protein
MATSIATYTSSMGSPITRATSGIMVGMGAIVRVPALVSPRGDLAFECGGRGRRSSSWKPHSWFSFSLIPESGPTSTATRCRARLR